MSVLQDAHRPQGRRHHRPLLPQHRAQQEGAAAGEARVVGHRRQVASQAEGGLEGAAEEGKEDDVSSTIQ